MAIPIVFMLNGSPLRAYNPPYVLGGRALVPVAPFLTRIADRISYSGGEMIIVRGNSTVRVRTGVHDPSALQSVYVPAAAALRALGARVSYNGSRRELDVETGSRALLQSMQPSAASVPAVAPTTVFTPEPVPTPRPVYSGSPHPRRTPIVRMTSRP